MWRVIAVVVALSSLARADDADIAAGYDAAIAQLITVTRDNHDCARMAKVIDLVYDRHRRDIERGTTLIAAGHMPSRVLRHLEEYVLAWPLTLQPCFGDHTTMAAVARFMPASHLDEHERDALNAIDERVADAAVANTRDCTKLAAAITKIANTERATIDRLRSRWTGTDVVLSGGRTMLASERMHAAIRAHCGRDPGVDAAFGKLLVQTGLTAEERARYYQSVDDIVAAVEAHADDCKQATAAATLVVERNLAFYTAIKPHFTGADGRQMGEHMLALKPRLAKLACRAALVAVLKRFDDGPKP